MKRRKIAGYTSSRVFAAAQGCLNIETLEPRSMLAADTSDTLVTILPVDETPACVWTPTDAQAAVSPVDPTVVDLAPVPYIATDPVPPMYSDVDPIAALPIFVVDPSGASTDTGLLTDGTTQGAGDPCGESVTSDSSADGSAANTPDPGNGLTADPTGDTTQGTDAPPSDTSTPDGSTDGSETDMIDTGDGQGLVLDHVIPVDPPVWEMRDWGRGEMVEDLEAVGVVQPPVDSPEVNFTVAPVAFAGSDRPVAAVSPDSRAAAFATVAVREQTNAASMYAAFAAGFSQGSSDNQGSQGFAGTKRSARR